jgi:type II secretion system protein N
MKRLRAGLAYSFYVVVLGAFFVYFLFPAEAVNRYIVARAAAVRPDVRLTIDDVAPVLPPGLKLQRVTIAQNNVELLRAPEVRLYPRWLSLLGNRPSLEYTAVAGLGKIRGAASVSGSETGRQIRMDADLQSVRMEKLGMLRPFADYRLEGAISGKIRYFKGRKQTADVRMTVSGVSVAPSRPVLGLRKLRFDNVRTEATLEERNLKVSRVTLTGEQINGELTGNVVLGRRLADSRLSLEGTLQLNLRGSGAQPSSRTGGSDGGELSLAGRVPVRIRGTLANPRVSLR